MTPQVQNTPRKKGPQLSPSALRVLILAGFVTTFLLGYWLARPSAPDESAPQAQSAVQLPQAEIPIPEPGKQALPEPPMPETEQAVAMETETAPRIDAPSTQDTAPTEPPSTETTPEPMVEAPSAVPPSEAVDNATVNAEDDPATEDDANPFHPQGDTGILGDDPDGDGEPNLAEEVPAAQEDIVVEPEGGDEEIEDEPIEDDGALHGEIGKNEGFSVSAMRAGLSASIINQLVSVLEGVLDVRTLQPGQTFEAGLNENGELAFFHYFINDMREIRVKRVGNTLIPLDVRGETVMRVEPVAGRIEFSLSNALWRLGENDKLTEAIADVFAWDIDFYSDTQKGDEFKALVEKYYYEGRFVRYGRVLTAQYIGKTVGDIRAYSFGYTENGEEKSDFYNAKGESVRKSFLKAPINTTRVTSKFGFRMHPTLHKYKAHNGVDFGAPSGTPVWAAANGTVTHAGWAGACGKMVKIRHVNNVVTIYCHLSSIGVNNGQYVNQKQYIGRVGNTGRSTGPHLHYGMTVNGKYVNPIKPHYQPGVPVPQKYKEAYEQVKVKFNKRLEDITVPEFYTCALPPDYIDPTKAQAENGTASSGNGKRRNQARQGYNPPRPQGINPAR